MKLTIADNMGLNLENVSYVWAFQNFSPSSFLPLLSTTSSGKQIKKKKE